MATTNFADVMAAERQRLEGALDDVTTRRQAIENEAAALRRELAALDAYERAKSGKTAATGKGNGSRASRGSRSETLLTLIAGYPDGRTRSQILDELGVKGDKRQEGSISNALTTMKKQEKLALNGGVYTAA